MPRAREDLDAPPRIAADRDRNPELPGAWSSWSFSEHSDKGEVPGGGGHSDLNFFDGDEYHLKRLALL